VKIENRVVSIGSDPECFVFAGEKLRPAFEILPSKDDAAFSACIKIYWDGFQAEYSHQHAFHTIEGHRTQTRWALGELSRKARLANVEPSYLSTRNVVPVETEGLRTEYVMLGCKPSMNAYGLHGDDPGDPYELPIRFSGGHIHLGIPKLSNPMRIRIVKTMDAILGLYATVLFAYEIEGDGVLRRKYYGLPGEFRPTKYGLEYRVLSSAWLQSPELHDSIFNLAVMSANFAMSRHYKKWIAPERAVIDCIKFGEVESAMRMLRRNAETFAELTQGMNLPVPILPPTKGSLEKAWGIAA